METVTQIVTGEAKAGGVADALARGSAWFTCTPLPDNAFEFAVKPDRAVHLSKAVSGEGYATPEQIECARDEYARCSDNNIEIDDECVKVSRVDAGTWVQAWVWLQNEDGEEVTA